VTLYVPDGNPEGALMMQWVNPDGWMAQLSPSEDCPLLVVTFWPFKAF